MEDTSFEILSLIAAHWAWKTRGIFRFKIDSENSNYQRGRALHRVGNVLSGFGMKCINHMSFSAVSPGSGLLVA